ncbi:MAG: hypothetical protein IJL87_07255 [Clostridia bacterium]|nr:hypothetical protein [Clostridia bacterium]
MQKKITIAGINCLLKWDFEGLDLKIPAQFISEFNTPALTYRINMFDKKLYEKICSGRFLCDINDKKFIEFDNKIAAVILHNPQRPYFTLFSQKNPEDLQVYIFDKELKSASIMELLFFESLLPCFNGFMLHSSLIDYEKRGIMFSAPSGTGKSTQADLWNKYTGARIINGDRVILRRTDDIWWANGSPWSGTSGISLAENVPAKALLILRQAPENRLEKLPAAQAVKAIVSEAMMPYWSDEMTGRTIELAGDFVSKVPTYMLYCRPDRGAVEIVKQMVLNI